MSRYTDKWSIKGTNELDIGRVGFESRFKYATLNLSFNSLPSFHSTIGVHRPDSLLFGNATIALGSPKIVNIRWFSEKETDIVHELPASWQTHFLLWNISAGTKFENHQAELAYGYLKTDPKNPDRERYVRDSIQAFYLSGNYKGAFAKDTVEAFYAFANAGIYLFGITHEGTSRKRFMYFPIEASLHLAEAKWKRENLQAHLDFFHISGEMKSNPNRFFETLAANRALPTSVLKSISFAFLQKTFRVDADLNAFGFLGGATYQWHFGNRFTFAPRVNLDAFFAMGETNISKKSETTSFIILPSYVEANNRKISGFGSILTLGCEISKGKKLALDYSVMQLIPFHIGYKEKLLGEAAKKDSDNKNSSSGGHSSSIINLPSQHHDAKGDVPSKASAAFRNGFATNLSVIFKI